MKLLLATTLATALLSAAVFATVIRPRQEAAADGWKRLDVIAERLKGLRHTMEFRDTLRAEVEQGTALARTQLPDQPSLDALERDLRAAAETHGFTLTVGPVTEEAHAGYISRRQSLTLEGPETAALPLFDALAANARIVRFDVPSLLGRRDGRVRLTLPLTSYRRLRST